MQVTNYTVPKEKRVSVYSVFENEIINTRQKEQLVNLFQVDTSEIAIKRNECFDAMIDKSDLNSYIYVHENGNIETEINVAKPKYTFHRDYSKE